MTQVVDMEPERALGSGGRCQSFDHGVRVWCFPRIDNRHMGSNLGSHDRVPLLAEAFNPRLRWPFNEQGRVMTFEPCHNSCCHAGASLRSVVGPAQRRSVQIASAALTAATFILTTERRETERQFGAHPRSDSLTFFVVQNIGQLHRRAMRRGAREQDPARQSP